MDSVEAVKIEIAGLVQGVGFRPFAVLLALETGVAGTVRNTGAGVEIEAEAASPALERFVALIVERLPKHAHIASLTITKTALKGFSDFTILPSSKKAGVVFVPIDTATCAECEKELFDPQDRRYLYPFINCTKCGPRYSIIYTLPYDRPSTSMREFPLCSDCEGEYKALDNRRFHAEPNACGKCGPAVTLGSLSGIVAVKEAARLIDEGEIAAVKGVGGYHLICDAKSSSAVKRLRELKRRPTKPFAVMARDPAGLPFAPFILSAGAPIVIVDLAEHTVAPEVNPLSLKRIGVMAAYTPLHKLLLSFTKTDFVVATSGNVNGEPIIADNSEALSKLSKITPHFLSHNRGIVNAIDDSVGFAAAGEFRLLRRGRGFAPFPVTFGQAIPPVFAAGAYLKASLTLTKGKYAFVSAYIGDTDNAATADFYDKTYENMARLLRFTPQIALCDIHPAYYSTGFALKLGVPVERVQHHKAHLYSVMAEHSLTDNVVGIVMDGAGYGEDGKIWGGEVFALQKGVAERAFHLEEVWEPGFEAAAKSPKLMAVSWLMKADMWGEERLVKRLSLTEVELALTPKLVEKEEGGIFTSSAGRLCEAMGALLAGVADNEFEAHAAMALEALAGSSEGCYPFDFEDGSVLLSPAVRALAKDFLSGAPLREAAAKWHNTLASAMAEAGIRAAKPRGISDVALSGGVFQNKLLLEKVNMLVTKAGLNCYMHKAVPANDGGISLGQAYGYYLRRTAH